MDTSLLHKVKVVDIIEETPLAKTFVLQPLNNWQPGYRTGQFLTLVFYNTGTEKRRSFSLISDPAKDRELLITVKRVINGEYSRYMLDHVIAGDEFYTIGITGFFTLPVTQPDNISQLFFLAAGSGITPVFALINHTLQYWSGVSIVLIYSNRNRRDIIFHKQLMALEQQHANFTIEWLFSDSHVIHTARLSNYLLNILLAKYRAGKTRTLYYMCGPFDYMLTIQITLLSYGVPPNHIYKEQFSTLPRMVKPVPPDTDRHNAVIHISGKTYHFSVQYPATILAAAKAESVMLPYSCEAGRCGSCAATCISGKIWMAYNEVLMDNEISNGRVLVCQAYPIGGDVTIQFD